MDELADIDTLISMLDDDDMEEGGDASTQPLSSPPLPSSLQQPSASLPQSSASPPHPSVSPSQPSSSSFSQPSTSSFSQQSTSPSPPTHPFSQSSALPSASTSLSSQSTSSPLHPTSQSTSPPLHSTSSKSSHATMAELGLVMSDDEDQDTTSTTKSKFAAAFSQSKFSRNHSTENLKSQNFIKEAEKMPTSITEDESVQNLGGSVDPLEEELQLMEQRVQMLKQQLLKKRKFNEDEGTSTRKFTRLTKASPRISKTQSSRTLSDEETSRLYERLKKNSELHRGETDSEDEEDNRNPMEQRYNDCGRAIKKRIAHESNQAEDRQRERILARVKRMEEVKTMREKANVPQIQESRGSDLKVGGWNRTSGSLVALKNGGSALPDTDQNVSVDSYSGIRIVNPLVTNDQMSERMCGRKMVRMSTILLHLRGGEIEGDWVTIGVVVSKSDPKTSQKGSQYSIWKLSDLNDCTKTVALFLFSGAHKALWKSSIGSVVGLLNPTIMKERKSDNFASSDILSLSIFDAQRAMLMGSSKDLGWCKGTTKQNQRCRAFVNKASCEFCVYHIQREYQKTSSKRADIQSSFTRVDPKRRLQEKVLGKDQVFYGGQLYTAPAPAPPARKLAQANRGKDLATLNSLKIKLKTEELKEEDKRKSFTLRHMSDGEISAVQEVVQKNNPLSERLLAPTPGARNLLRHMAKEEVVKKEKAGAIVSVSAKDLLSMTHRDVQARRMQQQGKSLSQPVLTNPQPSQPSVKHSPPVGPKLGRGVTPGGEIDLEISPPPPQKPDMAKARAMALLQKKGGIQAKDPNAVKNRTKAVDPQFQSKVQQRLNTSTDSNNGEVASQTSKLTAAMAGDTSRSKLGSLDANSDKFKAMVEQKSRHTHLVDAVENEALDKYYQGLEKKEMLEEKMASVMEIPTTAYACLKCRYLSESASEFCREENHPLKTVKAKKRFFECKNCKRRTSSLDKLPRKACGNCDQHCWQRVAMGKAKKGPTLDSEILSLRGDELKHYSGSSSQVYLHI